MGRRIPFLLIVFQAVATVLTDDLLHYITDKSFDTALRECAQYFLISNETLARYYQQRFPCVDEVKQLVRCTMINLNAYDDNTGPLENVLGNFFKPHVWDTKHTERTKNCVARALNRTSPSDVFQRAYDTFICYYHQLGTLVSDDQLVPCTPLEFKQVMTFVESALNMPAEVLLQYSQGNVLNEPSYPNALYIFAVRAGYYSVSDGIQLGNLYTQFGVPEISMTLRHRRCANS
ncbi:general odorant-binding protein 69-like [Armigeres subalbatus]|uniref:general odorant-binding protein 69-like n=1 Tax=Armigeres subalbatus TaxID=124917 RepID=UPI002ED6B53E